MRVPAPQPACTSDSPILFRADANLVVQIRHWNSKEKKFSLLAWSFLPAHVLITRSDGGIYGADGAPF